MIVPRRVRDALTTWPTDEDGLQTALFDLARQFALHADAQSISIAEDLVTVVSQALTKDPSTQGAFALRLFVTVAPYFDRVGRTDVPPKLAHAIVASAESWSGIWARRCAHQFAAVVHLQADDARQAWTHAELAYDLAAGFEVSSGRLETLVLVVAILDNMGLLRDAKTLAQQLLAFPDGEPALDLLHLVNAIAGLSLCQRLDDRDTASRFHKVAVAKARARERVDLDPIGACFASASALYLAGVGSARTAARQIDEALARWSRQDDRVVVSATMEAALRSAQVEVYMVLDDRPRVDSALSALKDLLPAFHGGSASHRALLRTIIRFQLRRSGEDTAVAARYLEMLRERPCPVTGESDRSTDVLLQCLLGRVVAGVTGTSTQADAPLFQEVGTRDWAKDPWRGRRFADFGFQLPRADADADADPDATSAVLSLPEREAALRTTAFEIAENWAVVAEIAIGGDGRQCFKVGRIAAGMAAALGFSDERTIFIELACRLRNIGDATCMSESTSSTPVLDDRTAVLAEHAQAGARVLSFSGDPVLRLATRIAANHHAWWNGSGVPGGLVGESIPIEARICAVADQLVSLVDPIGACKPWSIERALQQLRCMGGVQLDPELVDVLASVLHDEGMRVEDAALRLNDASWNDPLAKARKRLIETLELAA